MMLLVSSPMKGNLVGIYIAGCIGATVLEYVTGVVMEALFKVRYWDYSHKKIKFPGADMPGIHALLGASHDFNDTVYP